MTENNNPATPPTLDICLTTVTPKAEHNAIQIGHAFNMSHSDRLCTHNAKWLLISRSQFSNTLLAKQLKVKWNVLFIKSSSNGSLSGGLVMVECLYIL